ncbi:M16 family metallopeptidase [Longibacter salinarum]|nr:M16 family metallopeptidase [Longibacter salinarum]
MRSSLRSISRLALGAVLLMLLAWSPFAQAQQADADTSEEALPVDPAVRTGTLDNGMRFYIRQNDEPEDRLQLRLALNAGSILETDAQRGLAHFLEHMLFNGTENFEEQKLIDFLERTGMEFGPDVNAYTSFDETVYKLRVPTDSLELVKTSFMVLRDWASRATLSEEEIDKERGVVIEEWRQSQETAQGRMQDDIVSTLFAGSRYADRLPIGDTSVVKNAPYSEVRDYYETWYRPDLMAIIAVGDMDPDMLETMIRDRFSDFESPSDPQERKRYDVPAHEDTKYAVVTDPEYPVSSVATIFKTDAQPVRSKADFRRMLKERLFFSMLNARLSEKAQSGDAPFLGAGGFNFTLARPMKGYGLQAQVPEDSIVAGMEALLTEATRIRQHGFTDSELIRQKRDLLRSYETSYNERENIPSQSLAQQYVQLFLTGESAPGIETEYELAKEIMPTITLADVNAVTSTIVADRNRAVLVQMPEKEGLEPPSEDTLAAVLDRVRTKDVEPYEDEMSDVPLMADIPEPAGLKSTETIDTLGTTVWTLENGVTVVHKPTEFKDDEIRFTATSPGGASTISDDAYRSMRFAPNVVRQSGVGPFDNTALKKYLQGKSVSVSPYISSRDEGMNGSASPQDLETMFQLIHSYATAPRIDANALQSFKQQLTARLKNRSATPTAALQDTLVAKVYDNHPRVSPPEIAEVEALIADSLLGYYRTRFADASDFTFTFAGNVPTDSLAQFARTYLGTLPTIERTDEVRAVTPAPPNDVVEAEVRAGQGQRSIVLLTYNGDIEYTRENRHALTTLSDVLSIKLREELREKRGGTYNVGVRDNTTGPPYNRYSFTVSFVCDPDRAADLLAAAKAEIDSVRTGGVTADDIAKVQEQQRRSRETAMETNSFWVSALDQAFTTESVEPLDIYRYEELVSSSTPETVAQTAQSYLNENRYYQVVLYPEDFEANAETSDGEASTEAGEK